MRDIRRREVVGVASEIGADAVKKVAGAMQWCRPIKDTIYVTASAHHSSTLGVGHDGRRLIGRCIFVRYKTDDQPIARGPRLAEELDVTGVEKITNHIRIDPNCLALYHLLKPERYC